MNENMSTIKKLELYGFYACVVLCVVAVWYMQTSYSLLSLQTSVSNSQTAAVSQVNVSSDQDRASQISGAFNSRGQLSGLITEDIRLGSGAEVTAGSVVQLHYTAALVTGEVVEDSKQRGQIMSFRQGRGSVIAGLDQGVLGMKEGGTRVLVVPADLAYGNTRQRNIPANSPLVLTIEVISVTK